MFLPVEVIGANLKNFPHTKNCWHPTPSHSKRKTIGHRDDCVRCYNQGGKRWQYGQTQLQSLKDLWEVYAWEVCLHLHILRFSSTWVSDPRTRPNRKAKRIEVLSENFVKFSTADISRVCKLRNKKCVIVVTIVSRVWEYTRELMPVEAIPRPAAGLPLEVNLAEMAYWRCSVQ